jgi:hypothetical protein
LLRPSAAEAVRASRHRRPAGRGGGDASVPDPIASLPHASGVNTCRCGCKASSTRRGPHRRSTEDQTERGQLPGSRFYAPTVNLHDRLHDRLRGSKPTPPSCTLRRTPSLSSRSARRRGTNADGHDRVLNLTIRGQLLVVLHHRTPLVSPTDAKLSSISWYHRGATSDVR